MLKQTYSWYSDLSLCVGSWGWGPRCWASLLIPSGIWRGDTTSTTSDGGDSLCVQAVICAQCRLHHSEVHYIELSKASPNRLSNRTVSYIVSLHWTGHHIFNLLAPVLQVLHDSLLLLVNTQNTHSTLPPMHAFTHWIKNLPAVLLVKMMGYCIQNSILVHRVIYATVGGAGVDRGGVGQGRGEGQQRWLFQIDSYTQLGQCHPTRITRHHSYGFTQRGPPIFN